MTTFTTRFNRMVRREVPAIEDIYSSNVQACVARELDEIIAAWRLVYRVYHYNGLINPNPHEIHTAPQTINPRTAVFTSFVGSMIESTYTTVIDGPQGLPLDRVYRDDLSRLRDQGRKLMECCLFADVRQAAEARAARPRLVGRYRYSQRESAGMRHSMIELMRMAVCYGRQQDVTDYVVGVHPRHAKFYARTFGFEQLGAELTYPTVNNRPVVLLRADFADRVQKARSKYPVLDYLVSTPMPRGAFRDRFEFCDIRPTSSLREIANYLHDMYPGWNQLVA